MSNDIDRLAERAQWVGDVKLQLQKLNELLAEVPEGIDVKVTTAKVNGKVGGVTEYSGANQVWNISVSATKTETLI